MGIQILESNNYSKFEMTEFNRDVRITKRLEASMLKHGWIDACPLHVIRNGGGKLKIKQGHHRFIAAQNIGIPVKYVECRDDATIFDLEATTVRWSMQDYLVSHCRTGKKEYLKVRQYCDESGISLQLAISMLGGQAAGSDNFQRDFKEGRYKTKEESNHADTVKDIVLHVKNQGIPFYNHSLLVQAISKIVWVPELSLSQLKNKIKLFHSIFEKKVNLEQYMDLLEETYNRQSRGKLPLKFLAMEESKRRRQFGLSVPKTKNKTTIGNK
jgi:hypothetical protein